MPQQSWVARPSLARPRSQSEQPLAPREPMPFFDAAARAAEDQMVNSNDGGRRIEWRRYLRERHARIEAITGETLPWMLDMDGSSAFGAETAQDLDPYGADAGVRRQAQAAGLSEADYERRLVDLRRRFPQLATVPDVAALRQQFDYDLRMRRTVAQQAGEDQPVAAFVGGAGASMIDPVNIAATVATGGVGASRPLLVRMGMQAAANVGAETLATPGRASQAVAYGGPEYSGEQAAADIVLAGAGGAGVEVLGAGLKAGWRAGAAALARSGDDATRGVGLQLERLESDDVTLAGADDFDAARAALQTGGPIPRPEPDRDLDSLFADGASGTVSQSQPDLSPDVVLRRPNAEPLTGADYRGRRIWSGRFDPLALETDAARFQYKAEGDAQGVTGRLRGVERWDATASGKAILFEQADGRRFVADGHQRRGLAARLSAEGWEDARLDGYLFREADGWTAREVRVVAALKNLREGSGAIMDAAKLFREAPQALRDRSLPVTGDFITQARQLANLDEGAFRAVVNGVIPERMGAVIGEQAGDRPDLQGDLVALLAKADPASIDGARALIQEARLDDFIATEGVQLDLFGGLPRQATLIARGQIREAVMRSLRRDERMMAQLVRNADAIEAGGNVLARDANEARLAVDRAASELVSKLALRSGEMGEAFQEAARSVTLREATAAQAAKGLTARIREAVRAGEALEQVRAELLDPAPPVETALAAVKAFDEPGGTGQAAQIAPKPEDADFETGGAPAGLFDDLPEDDGLDRAVQHLTACAPGRG